MKCVILAAGRGERMMPLTKSTPKPLLKVKGKCLIDYVIDALPAEIDELIVVTDYLGNKIRKHLNKKHYGKKIRYVQGSDKGNVYSFWATKKYLNSERFLVVYADEIPTKRNIQKCLYEDLSILTFNNGEYDGVMVLSTKIFNYAPKNGSLKSLVEQFVKDNTVYLIEAVNFLGGINTPDDLERAEKWLK